MIQRGMVRSKLREVTTPAPELSLRDEGERVVLSAGEHRVTLPTDGTVVRVSHGDRASEMRARRRDGGLVVSMRGENGTRTTAYRLSEDGRRVVLDVRMESERLDAPLRYRASYVRR